MARPFALLVARPPSAIADAEYEEYLERTGLTPDMLHRISLAELDLDTFDLDRYAAFIATGSPYSYRADDSEKNAEHRKIEEALDTLVRRFIDDDLPYFGACYGLQAIAKVYGDELTPETPDPLSIIPITLTEEAQDDPIFGTLPREFYSIIGHDDSLSRVPDGATLLAYSANCPIQAVRVKNNVYGVQFHPEIGLKRLHVRVDNYAGRYFEPGEGPKIMAFAQTKDLAPVASIIEQFAKRYRDGKPSGAVAGQPVDPALAQEILETQF